MASALAILDSNADCLISRIYTTDILPLDSIFTDFKALLHENSNPILRSNNGVNYIYIKSNDIYLLIITYYDHINCMTQVQFLYKFKDILLNYFKTKELVKDLIQDNFNLIYELMDEIMDFGIPQFTDFNILQDFIKLEFNESEVSKDPKEIKESKDLDDFINTSIIRTTTSNISWRPKGIFYTKNEFFLDVEEKLTMIINPNGKISKYEILGVLKIKSFLSGMPILKIGLNCSNANLNKFQFHQCVELDKFIESKTLQFIPPDGDFILGTYKIPMKSLPILEIDPIKYEQGSNKIILKLNIKTNLSVKLSLNNLKIVIPIDFSTYKDIDKSQMPMFKTKIGKVRYKLDQDCLLWEIPSLGGDRSFEMMAMFKLETKEPEIKGMDPPPKRADKNYNLLELQKNMDVTKVKNLVCEFEILDIAWSGLKVEFLTIEEPSLKYPTFPWVRYKTINDEYVYRL